MYEEEGVLKTNKSFSNDRKFKYWSNTFVMRWADSDCTVEVASSSSSGRGMAVAKLR